MRTPRSTGGTKSTTHPALHDVAGGALQSIQVVLAEWLLIEGTGASSLNALRIAVGADGMCTPQSDRFPAQHTTQGASSLRNDWLHEEQWPPVQGIGETDCTSGKSSYGAVVARRHLAMAETCRI